MSEFRYILEPYKGLKTRYTCPECGKPKKFARYIDKETGEHLGDNVGRCERSDNCGWHYTPKQHFADTGQAPDEFIKPATPKKIEPVKPISYIDENLLQQSLSGNQHNNFTVYLSTLFDADTVEALRVKYKIGTSKKWPGSTVFWQIDKSGGIRSGKVMQYNATTGKRVKKPYDMVTWVHSILKKEDFNLSQCFFGEHLMPSAENPIAIVESEKTAIIASAYLPQLTWLACGNKNGLSDAKCKLLTGHGVILYPDLNAFEEWNNKAKRFGFRISDLLERKATEQERSVGLDLADYLVRFDVSEFQDPTPIETHSFESSPRERTKADPVQPDEPAAISSPAVDPELLMLHTQYSTAAAAGKLDDHPDRSLIGELWQAVLINRSRPAQLHYYIEQLKQITL